MTDGDLFRKNRIKLLLELSGNLYSPIHYKFFFVKFYVIIMKTSSSVSVTNALITSEYSFVVANNGCNFMKSQLCYFNHGVHYQEAYRVKPIVQ